MKFSSIATLSGLAALAAANPVYTVEATVDVVCTEQAPSTVYETVTVFSSHHHTRPPFVTTVSGTVTSVDYNGPTSTVYVYPTGPASHDVTVAIYNEIEIVNVVIINVSVSINNGQTVTVTSTKTDKPTSTPLPPPPVTTTQSSSTTSSTSTTSTTSTTSSTTASATHLVQVGVNGTLAYGPNQLNANKGDIVRFEFLKLNHTVTQSSFQQPCTPLKGGFNTGFTHFNPSNSTDGKFFTDFTVDVTTPLWFYCAQTEKVNHCHSGMVLGINPLNKFAAFQANAEAQGNGNSTVVRRYQPRAVSWAA